MSKIIFQILAKLEDLDRRIACLIRPAKTVATDPTTGKLQVTYAKDTKGNDVVTNWTRFATKAGVVRDWNLPSVGEQVIILSPSGDISGEHSYVLPGGYSNDHRTNHDQDNERKIQVGEKTWIHWRELEVNVVADQAALSVKSDEIKGSIDQASFSLKGDKIVLSVGSSRIEIAEGEIKLIAAKVSTN